MLSSPVFRGSKRLSGFLRYIVIDTLDNGGAELKERLIGVHVFGRPADYDTSAEPVVRVSAGDLRKRIAQYYHEPACEHELRIDLPVGSYHPVFHLPSATVTVGLSASGPSMRHLTPPCLAPWLLLREMTRLLGGSSGAMEIAARVTDNRRDRSAGGRGRGCCIGPNTWQRVAAILGPGCG